MVWFWLCGLCRRTISRRFWSSWLLHLRFCARYVALCDSELSWSCQKRLENYSLVVSIASTVTRLDIDACIKTAQYLFGSHLLQQYQVVILWSRLLTVLPPLPHIRCGARVRMAVHGCSCLVMLSMDDTHTHTHTRLTALFPGQPGWAGTRKVKPIWILLKQETLSGSGISWAVCKSAPRSRQITTANTSPLSFLLAGCPSCHPTNSVKTLKAVDDVDYKQQQKQLADFPLSKPDTSDSER